MVRRIETHDGDDDQDDVEQLDDDDFDDDVDNEPNISSSPTTDY